MDQAPDFNPRSPSKFDFTINVPSVLSIIGGAGTVAFFFVSMWSDAKIERNDMNWKIKSLELEWSNSRKQQDDQQATIKQLSEQLLLTNQSLAHTAQLVEWFSKQSSHP